MYMYEYLQETTKINGFPLFGSSAVAISGQSSELNDQPITAEVTCSACFDLYLRIASRDPPIPRSSSHQKWGAYSTWQFSTTVFCHSSLSRRKKQNMLIHVLGFP